MACAGAVRRLAYQRRTLPGPRVVGGGRRLRWKRLVRGRSHSVLTHQYSVPCFSEALVDAYLSMDGVDCYLCWIGTLTMPTSDDASSDEHAKPGSATDEPKPQGQAAVPPPTTQRDSSTSYSSICPEERAVIDVASLLLPQSTHPRPGDAVTWFRRAQRDHGTLSGHQWDGKPIIRLDDVDRGFEILDSFEIIRRSNPDVPICPNWRGEGGPSLSVAPTLEERDRLSALLEQRVQPGPTTRELIEEVFARGFEIFVVGGTVRDVIRGQQSEDVDVGTTMPLRQLLSILRYMYGLDPAEVGEYERQHGYLRLGGSEGTNEPYVDLTVFRWKNIGLPSAAFSSRFDKDAAHRDFACNAVYYDPSNVVIHDVSGFGISDCENSELRLTADDTTASPEFKARLVIRSARFVCCSGFKLSPASEATLSEWANSTLTTISNVERGALIKKDLFGDCLSSSDRDDVMQRARDFFTELGAQEACSKFVEPLWSGGPAE